MGSASSGLWDLQGNAMVMTQYIRLTPDLQSKQGAVWNRVVSPGAPGGEPGWGLGGSEMWGDPWWGGGWRSRFKSGLVGLGGSG